MGHLKKRHTDVLQTLTFGVDGSGRSGGGGGGGSSGGGGVVRVDATYDRLILFEDAEAHSSAAHSYDVVVLSSLQHVAATGTVSLRQYIQLLTRFFDRLYVVRVLL
jgi:hypothetical protein